MPTGLIHPEINQHSLITKEDILQHGKKSVGIAFFLTHHPMSAPDGIDPSKDIQPLVMLALRQDQRLFPFFHPDLPQLWMKTKPRFIRKKKDSFSFTSLSDQEFFLRSSEIPPPLPSWLEHTDKSVAAKKTLIDESIAELDAPSIEPHVSAPNTQPLPPHPSGFASNPMPWDSFLSPPPKPSESARQDGKDDLAVSFPLLPGLLSHWPSESISPRSVLVSGYDHHKITTFFLPQKG
jgi:hypothetical protein